MPITVSIGLKTTSSTLFGKAHEDFGLTPIILMLSKTVICINEPLYHYIRRTDSITKTTNYNKIKQNASLPRGRGLSNLRYRAATIGGNLSTSGENGCFKLIVVIPLKERGT